MRCVQEYEEKLRGLQAEYSAEQESKALLQDHIAALRKAYDAEGAASWGRCGPTHGNAGWICYV